jgi:hypothetical protein
MVADTVSSPGAFACICKRKGLPVASRSNEQLSEMMYSGSDSHWQGSLASFFCVESNTILDDLVVRSALQVVDADRVLHDGSRWQIAVVCGGTVDRRMRTAFRNSSAAAHRVSAGCTAAAASIRKPASASVPLPPLDAPPLAFDAVSS